MQPQCLSASHSRTLTPQILFLSCLIICNWPLELPDLHLHHLKTVSSASEARNCTLALALAQEPSRSPAETTMSNATNELALAPESFSPLRTCNNKFARVLQNAQLQSYIRPLLHDFSSGNEIKVCAPRYVLSSLVQEAAMVRLSSCQS